MDNRAFLRDLYERPAEVLARHGEAVPELARLRGCPQPRNHHAEGDVWNHTQLALARFGDLEQAIATFAGEQLAAAGLSPLPLPPRSLDQALAVLLHDVGKPATIQGTKGSWTYYGHDHAGARIALGLIERLDLVAAATVLGLALHPQEVAWLIREHLFWLNTDLGRVSDRAVAKRFVGDDGWGDDLRVLSWCDTLGSINATGRPFTDLQVAAEQRIRATRKRAEAAAARPDPVLDGGRVMATLDLQPGPRVGAILAWLRARTADEDTAQNLLARHRHWLADTPLDTLRAE